MTDDCGSGALANTLMTDLTTDVTVTLPTPDLSGPGFIIPGSENNPLFTSVTRLTNDDLTTGRVDGSGTFDALMRGFNAHLTREYENGRITGADYTKAYIALTEAAMANGTQYLLGRDQAYWAAVQAQMTARLAEIQAVTSRVEVESAKVRLAALHFEALNAKSTYAVSKMRLATESINYCTAEFNLNNIMPQQLISLQKEALLADKQIGIATEQLRLTAAQADGQIYTVANILPQQKLALVEETRFTKERADGQGYETTQILPQQKLKLVADTSMTTEQTAGLSAERLQLLPQRVLQLTGQIALTAKEAIQTEEQTKLVTAQTSNQVLLTSTMVPQQVRGATEQADAAAYQNEFLLPLQKNQSEEQVKLLKEQMETQRAQTLDTRTDGSPVAGVLGRQKLLSEQQVTSYQRDAELKASRMFVDAWITQKTLDEGLVPPNGFTNTSLDQVLTKIKSNNLLT